MIDAKFILEVLGTFLLLTTILHVGEPIPVALSLLVGIYIAGNISGAHFNPVISIVKFIEKKLSSEQLLKYIVAQILGGLLAYGFVKHILKK